MLNNEQDRSDADALKIQGNEYFAAGDYVKAVDYYMQAIDKAPSIIAYYTNAAMAFGKLEEHERAIEMASKAIQLEPTLAKPYYRRAISLMAMGLYKRAYDDLLRIIKATPKDADVKRNLEICDKALLRASFAQAIHVEKWDLTEKNIKEIEDPDSSYTGPRIPEWTIDINFVMQLISWYWQGQKLHKKYVYKILYLAKMILSKEKNVVDIELESPEKKITVCGDIHGQFYDMITVFDKNGYPNERHSYLFNGDFVDRGSYSIETVTTLLAFKAAFPSSFHLARGNHECEPINKMHGFYEECQRKYDDTVYSWYNKIFNYLPLAHVIGKSYFVVHGGLPEKASQKFLIEDIQKINRVCIPENGTIASQMLWSDPRIMNGIGPSHRGEGILWGPDITESFLAQNDLKAIIRSHVWEPNGLKIEHDGKCITIFSAPNYTGATSQAAWIDIDNNMKMNFSHFDAAEYQGKVQKNRSLYGENGQFY